LVAVAAVNVVIGIVLAALVRSQGKLGTASVVPWPHPLRPSCWIGGQGTEPYEQNTQQSPNLGLRSAAQPSQL
jgi:hypothetical protein